VGAQSAGSRPRFRIGVSPLSWTNDVLEDLGGDIPLETCLSQAAAAGYAGVELGRKFPRQAAELRPLLAERNLALVSGWYSGQLADRSVADEANAADDHARLLKALDCGVLVYGECGRMVPGAPLDAPMSGRLRLNQKEMLDYARRLGEFGARLRDAHGLRLAFHHHLMMVVETFDETCRLFDAAGHEVGLLLDTGHAAAAGFDYAGLIGRFGDRIAHIHLKDVRADVMRRVRRDDLSFNRGVRAGMFTVPGDGGVDFAPVAKFVRDSGYAGWLVVEAEQDPTKQPPLPTVSRAKAFVDSLLAEAAIG